MIQYFPIVTGSLTVLGNINVSGSITTSGSITISGSITSASFATSASNATNAISASYANNLTVAGTLTAQTLVVQTITSSVDFVTGSTRFGSLSSNTHVFTGSMYVTGAFYVTTGSVGIGTTSPSYLFDITKESDSNTSLAYIKNTAAGRPAYLSFKSPAYNFVTGIKNDVGYVIANNDGTISSNSQINFSISNSGVTTIFGDGASLIYQAKTANSELYFQLWNSAGSRRCYIGYGATSTTNLDIWNAENGDIKFGTNNTEKARITSNGTLGVGITTGTYNGRFCLEGDGTTTSNVHLEMSTDANRSYLQSANRTFIALAPLTIGSSSIIIEALAGSGSRTVTAAADGTLSASSDSSLKQEDKECNIPGLNEILQLQPRAYKWLSDIENRGEEATTEIGFFANEVNPLIPSAAPLGNDGLYGFYDRSVTAALVKAIQELNTKFEEYKATHP